MSVDHETAESAGKYLSALLKAGNDPLSALEATRHVFGFGEDKPVEGFDRVKRAAQLELDKQEREQ